MKKFIAFVAVMAFVLSASTVSASGWHRSSNDVNVSVSNSDTTVLNNVNTSASTGNNTANGGGSGNGGTIRTGDAISTSIVSNGVNLTDIGVRSNCGCKGDVNVDVRNDDTSVTNNVNTSASTGNNTANGGSGSQHHHHGHGSNGGNGGTITTGNADSLASVVNIVNSTVVRVRR